MDYHAHPPNFTGRFTKASKILDEEKYHALKSKHLFEETEKLDEKERYKQYVSRAWYLVKKNKKLTSYDVESIFDISVSTIRGYSNDWETSVDYKKFLESLEIHEERRKKNLERAKARDRKRRL